MESELTLLSKHKQLFGIIQLQHRLYTKSSLRSKIVSPRNRCADVNSKSAETVIMAQLTAPNVSLQTLSSARKTDDCIVCGLHYFSNSFQLGVASNLSIRVTFLKLCSL